jgi:hypothetical protein
VVRTNFEKEWRIRLRLRSSGSSRPRRLLSAASLYLKIRETARPSHRSSPTRRLKGNLLDRIHRCRPAMQRLSRLSPRSDRRTDASNGRGKWLRRRGRSVTDLALHCVTDIASLLGVQALSVTARPVLLRPSLRAGAKAGGIMSHCYHGYLASCETRRTLARSKAN